MMAVISECLRERIRGRRWPANGIFGIGEADKTQYLSSYTKTRCILTSLTAGPTLFLSDERKP
jgi:hypothetical protein